MKKIVVLFMVMFFMLGTNVKADEGMWLPFLINRLNYQDMKSKGLKLTPEEIYSVNHSSLKDAIIVFGGGCTGEIISDKGLILTNHHCGYSSIQQHSTVEHDYLLDGFWAMTMEEELPTPGLVAKFLVRIDDVTDRVTKDLNENMSLEEREKKIRAIKKEIVEEATKGTKHDAAVKSFFYGNEYYLFVYDTYKDIRMVGAPPSSIGNFGGDTDNWMWPRHTGDFSMFRVYTAPDGSPAEYSKDNIPMKPKHHLPISLKGYKEGDFAMIMGNPGSTERYLTSYGIEQAIDKKNPTIVDIRDKKLKVMKEFMDADQAVRIQYASKYARTANYWKYFQGQTKGLKRLKVADKKRAIEDNFNSWANNKNGAIPYHQATDLIKKGYETIDHTVIPNTYFSEGIMRGPEILGFALRNFYSLSMLLKENKDPEAIEKRIERVKGGLDDYFKDYYKPLDQKMLSAMLEMYYNNVPKQYHPEMLTKYYKKYKGNFNKMADKVFSKTHFGSKEDVLNLLDHISYKKLKKDLALKLVTEFYSSFRKLNENMDEADSDLSKGYRYFVKGLREMNPNKAYYPDANFTMRVTYGNIYGYEPADAVEYSYYTTLDGVMEKENPQNKEFVVPAKLKALYEAKDYGRYGENGKLKTCFLSNLDITGGNSGSPVIDGEGNLIGLAFDGNWEAMSGDIAFEPELQRTISADIRYVMFVIDKFAGCQRLIDEMTFVK